MLPSATVLHVVLFEPRIPQNTGSVSRQCVGMRCVLHLIEPLGFDITEPAVRRAGLDHWPDLELQRHADLAGFRRWAADRRLWLVTKYGRHRFDRVDFRDEDVLVFGSENDGLPEAWRNSAADATIRIPIVGPVRSFNLSNAVAMVLGAAMSRSGLYDTLEEAHG